MYTMKRMYALILLFCVGYVHGSTTTDYPQIEETANADVPETQNVEYVCRKVMQDLLQSEALTSLMNDNRYNYRQEVGKCYLKHGMNWRYDLDLHTCAQCSDNPGCTNNEMCAADCALSNEIASLTNTTRAQEIDITSLRATIQNLHSTNNCLIAFLVIAFVCLFVLLFLMYKLWRYMPSYDKTTPPTSDKPPQYRQAEKEHLNGQDEQQSA